MSSQPHHSGIQENGEPNARLTGYTRIAIALSAVYGPLLLALSVDRWVGGKLYFVLAIWAIEGILWYWHETRTDRRRRRELGVWSPEV